MTSRRGGVVLLEALCALVVLVVAGIALVDVTATCMRVIVDAGAVERTLEQQARVLTVHQLMTADELRERTGMRLLGDLSVDIAPISRGLFRVTVSTAQPTKIGPLTTVFYAVD